jgi:hypothetical protein
MSRLPVQPPKYQATCPRCPRWLGPLRLTPRRRDRDAQVHAERVHPQNSTGVPAGDAPVAGGMPIPGGPPASTETDAAGQTSGRNSA